MSAQSSTVQCSSHSGQCTQSRFLRSQSLLSSYWSHQLDTALSLVLEHQNLNQYFCPGLMLTSPPLGSAAKVFKCLLLTEPGPGWLSSSVSDDIRVSSSHGFLTKHSWLEEQLMAGSGLKQDFKADEKSLGQKPSIFRRYSQCFWGEILLTYKTIQIICSFSNILKVLHPSTSAQCEHLI